VSFTTRKATMQNLDKIIIANEVLCRKNVQTGRTETRGKESICPELVQGARGLNRSTAGESGRSELLTVSQWDILCSIVCETNSPSTSKSVNGRCMPFTLWKVYIIFMLWYDSKF
jgi:hypothetical protein